MDLSVTLRAHPVGDAPLQGEPLERVSGVRVTLHHLLVVEEHLQLELEELAPEAEVHLGDGDQVAAHHLQLALVVRVALH